MPKANLLCFLNLRNGLIGIWEFSQSGSQATFILEDLSG